MGLHFATTTKKKRTQRTKSKALLNDSHRKILVITMNICAIKIGRIVCGGHNVKIELCRATFHSIPLKESVRSELE